MLWYGPLNSNAIGLWGAQTWCKVQAQLRLELGEVWHEKRQQFKEKERTNCIGLEPHKRVALHRKRANPLRNANLQGQRHRNLMKRHSVRVKNNQRLTLRFLLYRAAHPTTPISYGIHLQSRMILQRLTMRKLNSIQSL